MCLCLKCLTETSHSQVYVDELTLRPVANFLNLEIVVISMLGEDVIIIVSLKTRIYELCRPLTVLL